MEGRTCRLVMLDPVAHTHELWEALTANTDGRNWTYLFADAPQSRDALRTYLKLQATTSDPLCHTIIDKSSGKAVGIASLMRIEPRMGVIEVGNINYSEQLKRSTIATEAMFLFMVRVFDELGYRRYEWKCDNFNAPSKAAAARLGFTYEGLFRQAVVYKGRNRDTAWFSIIDKEWPALKKAYQTWLDPANFDADGRQKKRLNDLIAAAR